jgi:hypothetical protein
MANSIIGSNTGQATHTRPTGTAPAFIYTIDLGHQPAHAKEKTAHTGHRASGMPWRARQDSNLRPLV